MMTSTSRLIAPPHKAFSNPPADTHLHDPERESLSAIHDVIRLRLTVSLRGGGDT